MEGKIPRHIAIIPDGNRRWAKGRGMKETAGHVSAGSYENMKTLFKSAQELGVEYVSIWGFSTENWKRNMLERDVIFDVISRGVLKFIVLGEEIDCRRSWLRKLSSLRRRLKSIKSLTRCFVWIMVEETRLCGR